MNEITQIRKLSLWIFFIPLIIYKSDFEKKTKKNDNVTIEIIVKFFTKAEI